MCSLIMHAADEALSSQNIDALSPIPGGSANKEIGRKLSITAETMKGHMKSMFNNLTSSCPHRYHRRKTRHRRFGFMLFSSGETQSGTSGLEFRLNGGEYNAS
jgi:hypothetical protein